MKIVNQSYRKKDAMQLVTGQPVYTDDLVPNDCLLVKVLRSPHANAIIESICSTVMYALWVTLWRLLPAKRKRLSIRRCL